MCGCSMSCPRYAPLGHKRMSRDCRIWTLRIYCRHVPEEIRSVVEFIDELKMRNPNATTTEFQFPPAPATPEFDWKQQTQPAVAEPRVVPAHTPATAGSWLQGIRPAAADACSQSASFPPAQRRSMFRYLVLQNEDSPLPCATFELFLRLGLAFWTRSGSWTLNYGDSVGSHPSTSIGCLTLGGVFLAMRLLPILRELKTTERIRACECASEVHGLGASRWMTLEWSWAGGVWSRVDLEGVCLGEHGKGYPRGHSTVELL